MFTKLRHWWHKVNCPYWQQGHPDDWCEAAWYYYCKER